MKLQTGPYVPERWKKGRVSLTADSHSKENKMATTVSLINMKGGVGKTTLAFNLAWYCAWQANLKVLAVDLDPQANLSQYFMGARKYLAYIVRTVRRLLRSLNSFQRPE